MTPTGIIDLSQQLNEGFLGKETYRDKVRWETGTKGPQTDDILPLAPTADSRSSTETRRWRGGPEKSKASILQFVQQMPAAACLSIAPTRGFIVWLLDLLPRGDRATEHFSTPEKTLLTQGSIDWDRWHELLDRRDEGVLALCEEIEYAELQRAVSQLDAEEDAIATSALRGLAERHERVLSSIARLTEAVKAAAKRASP